MTQVANCKGDDDFSYNDAEKWGEQFKGCREGVQSPINLEKKRAIKASNQYFDCKHYEDLPLNVTVINTGDGSKKLNSGSYFQLRTFQ